MKKNDSHLSAEERAVIIIERGKNTSATAIARILGPTTSTVTRADLGLGLAPEEMQSSDF